MATATDPRRRGIRFVQTVFAGVAAVAVLVLLLTAAPMRLLADGDDEAQLQQQLAQQQVQQAEQQAEEQEQLDLQQAQQAEQQGLLTEQQATLSVPGS
ncbi:hypothetical protein [Mycobacterium sp.]|uniref:hypothetical protein n=1 Tax=Mycobacterium sp. TaxID=1785 RepID=UPI0025DDA189|nr:hypothetical protein [Mycobacterium sp.]MBW0012763.1 hypothetical protein [Mycobacterium sp.]